MSKKEKNTILYSRNGIKIERTDYLYNTDNGYQIQVDHIESILGTKEVIKGEPEHTKVIKHESPLGFYYNTEVHVKATENTVIYDKAKFTKYTMYFGTFKIELTYPIQYREVSIDKETRPWDILPGYKGIPDHFIDDLYKEINKLFDIIDSNNMKIRTYKSLISYDRSPKYSEDINDIIAAKKTIMLNLFGDLNGPTVNYNDIKIESHGFDLKESFRKRKESK